MRNATLAFAAAIISAAITGIAIGIMLAAGLTVPPHATIGGNNVPTDLHCQEDEVISFVQHAPAPYELGCVHIDTLRD